MSWQGKVKWPEMTGEKEADQGKLQTNENTVNFQLPGEMALCHNVDNQELT